MVTVVKIPPRKERINLSKEKTAVDRLNWP
jgi:hypothetical protein